MRSLPCAENLLHLVEHGFRGEIADDDEQRIRRHVILAIVVFELLALVGGHLLFRRRDDRVRMLAEKHAAKALIGEKAGRGALDAELLEALAAFALEFVLREGSVPGQIGHQFEQLARKFREAGDRNRAGIGAGVRAEVGAHAAQVFLDLAAVARCGAGAHDGGRHSGDAGIALRDNRVAAAEEKLRRDFGERTAFGKHHLHAIRERAEGSLGPGDGALGTQGRRGSACECCGNACEFVVVIAPPPLP